MPAGTSWTTLQLHKRTLQRLREERARLELLYAEGGSDRPLGSEGRVTMDSLLNLLLDNLHKHRARAKAQAERRKAKKAAKDGTAEGTAEEAKRLV